MKYEARLKFWLLVVLAVLLGYGASKLGVSDGVCFLLTGVCIVVGGEVQFFIPFYKLCRALKPIDFTLPRIDFTLLDQLSYKSREMKFLLGKFNYLADAVSLRINEVNEAHRISESDGLTGCRNRVYLERRRGEYTGADSVFVIYIDVNNLKKMNDIYGHEAGDALIKAAANKLAFWESYGDVYRMGGDEFMVVLLNRPEQRCEELLERWYPTVGVLNRATDGFQCRMAYGTSYGGKLSDIDVLIKQADSKMYWHKKKIKTELGEPLTREG